MSPSASLRHHPPGRLPRRRPARCRPRALAAAAAAVALAALAGCADASGSPEPVASPSPPAGSPSPSSEATPAAGSAVELDASCRLEPSPPAGVPPLELAYPQGWDRGAQVDRPCRFFDPEPVDLPQSSDAAGVAVQWQIEPVAYAVAAEPDHAFTADERLPTVVDEHTAVRLAGVATGEAGLPEGAELVVWLIDVTGFGADADPATLVAAAHDRPQAVKVLDRMVRAADIGADADPAAGTTVARQAGGGAPFTVHHDRDTGCLELLAGTRPGRELATACELGTPDPLTAVRLTEGPHDLVVGLASSEVDVVRLHSDAEPTSAAATVPIGDGRRAYALSLGETAPTVVAETFAGRELGRRKLDPGP